MQHAGAAGKNFKRSLRRAHAQAEGPLKLGAGELTHAEGHATQLLNERKLCCMLDFRLLDEHALHFDFPVANEERQDQVHQVTPGAAAAQDHRDPPGGFFSRLGRHFLHPLRSSRRSSSDCR